VGDVSWNLPTIGFTTATPVPGVVAHAWQAAASADMSIGQQEMTIPAKAIAVTVSELFADPQLVQAAKADFERKLTGKTYYSAIPAVQKPLIGHREK
jgi:aminobenzoyl-glutamate utilization protein B